MPEKLDPDLDQQCRARARTVSLQDHSCLVLDATDLLLHTLVHGCKAGSRHGWMPDSLGLIQETTVDWPRLAQAAQQRGVVPQCRAGLTFLVEEMGAPVPPSALLVLSQLKVGTLDRLYFLVKTRRRRLWTLLLWPVLEFLRLPGSQRPSSFGRFLRLRWGDGAGLWKQATRRFGNFFRAG